MRLFRFAIPMLWLLAIPSMLPAQVVEIEKTIGAKKIQGYRHIAQVLPKEWLDEHCEITQFEVWFIRDARDPFAYINKGAEFSNIVLAALTQVQKNDQIYFFRIDGNCSNQKRQKTGTLKLRLR